MTVTSSTDNASSLFLWDEIAGEIHPSTGGACEWFSPDGRSAICWTCNHHLESHAVETWPELWRPTQVTRPKLTIGHVTWRESRAFVGKEHRHHAPSQGHMWSTGVFDNGRLCGVAVIGRPVSRKLQEDGDIEVVRLATDGTANACSALYGAAARQAVAHGYKRWQLLTYILESEPGTSLRAAGWVLDGVTSGGGWDRPGRFRRDKAPTCPKQRWRAAPTPSPSTSVATNQPTEDTT